MAINGYLCGCPYNECTGSHAPLVSKGMLARGGTKYHASRREAKNCFIRHLLRQGYTRTENSSCFTAPEHLGGHTLVLNRDSQFGGELRPGKSKDGKRLMHRKRTSGQAY